MIVSKELWNQSLPIFNKVHSDEEDGVGEIILFMLQTKYTES